MTSWILALDTSTPRACLALGSPDGGAPLLDIEERGANQASSTLADRIARLIAAAGIRPRDLAAIACGRGPGTFTGTRVAIATAKGVALGVGCPIYPISTLAALAASGARASWILAALDARRGEVYAATYRSDDENDLSRETDEICAPIEEAIAAARDVAASRPIVAVGPGVDAYAARLASADDLHVQTGVTLDAGGLWRAAVTAARGEAPRSPEALEAVYLRASYAQMGINRPKRPVARSPFV
ncbi:MAG: tRNA (adenosine(37)-N6)-threonylcarbamoyltransferase complex dimerization subunit type 1 TsaB [Nannocystaceae bacterium]|nr:tRNA (adenosine(37)-N6)-threonylcarbamoyltransferase complex dimerization subunit type 1 TsaB [Myxococcales bacterium]